MMRYFNTEGLCMPKEHYMVRLDDRLEKIKRLYIDRGKYFVINRGRQYGKTTTLRALEEYLKEDYIVVSMDFQGISTEEYRDEYTFTRAFARMFTGTLKRQGIVDDSIFNELQESQEQCRTLSELFVWLSKICAMYSRPIVMIIDEVDSASNNQVFIDFLAQLRRYYLNREEMSIFRSVILAGVYDIKNLKLKIRPDKEHQYNSPWNIAADFKVDMSFSAVQIADMLKEYETDCRTGMNIQEVAEEIYQYTSGYPYLVSAICKYLDEDIPDRKGFEDVSSVWNKKGITEAVKMLLNANIPLFGSMMRHVGEYPDLRQMLYTMLFQGERISYNPDNRVIELACMFGYVVDDNGGVQVANRIFETRLYNYFLSEEELSSVMSRAAKREGCLFVRNGILDMEKVLEKFVEHFTDVYSDNDEKFIETYGRKFFLLYLKPIINGKGNYYIEAQTRDARRTDIIVDYAGEQFIVEMKIWHGNEYHERGEQQLVEYLDYYRQEKGYMLSFNFNKKKEIGMKTVTVGDKVVVEAVV